MDNFFDPEISASPNLPESDPLREWAAQLQDPELAKLMAEDPAAAAKRMADLGIPPPPPQIQSYAEGGLGDERSRTMARPTEIVGGASPPPPEPSPKAPPFSLTPAEGSMGDKIVRLLGSTFGPQQNQPGQIPATGPTPGRPGPVAREALAPGPSLPGTDLDPEINPNPVVAGATPIPRENPTRSTDVGAQSKSKGDALSDFGKSLQGVKPVAPPAPNYVGTPSVRAPGHIGAPNLQALLNTVGQPGPSPLGVTLGRLLATGKA